MKFRNSLYALAIAGACSTSVSAQIIPINIASYTSASPAYDLSLVNAGVTFGNNPAINDFLFSGSGITLQIHNDATRVGLDPDGGGLAFVVGTGTNPARPFNFSAGAVIDGTLNYTSNDNITAFRYNSGSTVYTSPDFTAGSYIGFRFSSGSGFKYGWLEVTWNSTSGNFQVLNGAYEDTVNTAILAGATASPVPEASGSVAGLGLAVAGLHQLRRRRQKTVTQ